METIYAFIICILVVIIGLLLFRIALNFAALILAKKVSARSIFKDFGQKMWMTVWLGVFFFGLYLLIIYALSLVLHEDIRVNIFFELYQHPILFAYLGLTFFAFISTSIYLTRILIKYMYNRRK